MISQTLLTDLYQFTMMQGLFKQNKHRERCVFDRFYRKNPFQGSYTVVAGLEQAIEYIKNLSFNTDDLDYLQSLGMFEKDFLNYLKTFRFTGTILAVPEGTVVFPGEVLLRVEAPKDEAILLETTLSMILNHQSLIATKARRLRSVAGDDTLFEFGMRRAQGADAAIYGARAAYIGGFDGTSDVYSAALFDLKPVGTMAHSWVMSFASEMEAFRAYAAQYEHMLVLLVDTYDTLRQGVPNAIRLFEEVKAKRGGTMPRGYGIRLDSGDLAYLASEARRMLDEAGFTDARIMATNDLDETVIHDLKVQQAPINGWGVGTKLITADGTPALGGVYKLAGQWEGTTFKPAMKFSDNIEKVTNPGLKQVWRLIDEEDQKLIGDWIALEHERIDTTKDFVFKNPLYPWKQTLLKAGTYRVEPLLVPIFVEGRQVYEPPSLDDVARYGREQISLLWPEYLRLHRAPEVKVNISQELYELKSKLLLEKAKRNQ